MPPPLDQDVIPVRKGLWDWILFRTQTSMRRRLFGPPNRPTTRIPPAVKTRRLGEPARETMRLFLEEHLDVVFPVNVQELADRILGEYVAQVQDTLRGELNAKTEENKARLVELEGRLAQIGRIRDELGALDQEVADALGSMGALTGRYGETEPALLTQPVEETPLDEVEIEEPASGELVTVGGSAEETAAAESADEDLELQPYGAAEAGEEEAADDRDEDESGDSPTTTPPALRRE